MRLDNVAMNERQRALLRAAGISRGSEVRDFAISSPKRNHAGMSQDTLMRSIRETQERIDALQDELKAMKDRVSAVSITIPQALALDRFWSALQSAWADDIPSYLKRAIQMRTGEVETVTVWLDYHGPDTHLQSLTRRSFHSRRILYHDPGQIRDSVPPDVAAFMRAYNIRVTFQETSYIVVGGEYDATLGDQKTFSV